MKKTLLILLALLLAASMLLTACVPSDDANETETTAENGDENGDGDGDGGKTPSTPTPTIPSTPPAGYLFHTEDDLRFAYPNHWTVGVDEDGSTEISDEQGNSISVAVGSSAAIFQDITADLYRDLISSSLESEMGMDVSNETAEKRQNSLGLTVNVISVSIVYESIPMKQITYAATLNGTPYAIVLTLVSQNDALEETLFQSIVNLNPKPTTQDPNAPAGYKTVTNYNLRFAVPSNWTTDSTLPAKNATFMGDLYNLALKSGSKTSTFSDMTTQIFIDTMVPDLEADLEGTISNVLVEHKTNAKGLLVTVISYKISSDGISGWQYYYAVTIDQSTHLMILTLVADNADLRTTIFNSITQVSGSNVSA